MAAVDQALTGLRVEYFRTLLSGTEPTRLKPMNRILEADFLHSFVEQANEKPRILIIDNNGDFTLSAKLGLERTGRYSVWEENEPATAHQTAQRIKPDLKP
jgi:PleD family two-component response regulator